LNLKIVKKSDKFKEYLPIFGTKEFLQTKSDSYGWFISKSFVLPFYIDKRAIFSKLVFTTNSIVLKEDNEELFLDKVVVKSKELGVDLIAQPLANAVFSDKPKNSKYIEWGSYIVDLTQSEEKIWSKIHSKHKNVIRKAMKDGITIEESEDIAFIHTLLKETMNRQKKTTVSLEMLKRLKPFSKFYIAKKDAMIQGCAVLPFNVHGAYYLHGGSISHPSTGSLNYMHYYAMLEFKRLGVQRYDFMGARPHVEKGSKLEGIQRFKRRFGGELYQGYLWKYEFNPLKVLLMFHLQKIRYELKSKVYVGDAITQELSKCQKSF